MAFYAYIGFEDIVKVSEEVVEPKKTLSKGIILTLLIATILYIGVANAALVALLLDLLTLAKLTSLSILVVFTLTNLSLIRIKRRRAHAPFEVPIWVPMAGVVLNVALIVLSL